MAYARPPRGEYAKSAARRQEIVAAALEVFSEAGFHKGSIRDVAERAGLSQAGVLHHYPSKHLLLQAVLDWRDRGGPRPDGQDAPTRARHAPGPGRPDRAQHDDPPGRRAARHPVGRGDGGTGHPDARYFVRRYPRRFSR